MIIEIRKKKGTNDNIWFYVMKDGICIEATTDEKRAHDIYDKIRNNALEYVEVVIKREEIHV